MPFYVNAFVHLDQFADRAKFSTWLTKIAVYEALARTRRAKRETSVADDRDAEGAFMDRLPSADRTPEAKVYGQELGGLLESAVAALPEIFRSVFMLRDVEGMSTSDGDGPHRRTPLQLKSHRCGRPPYDYW